MGDWPSRSRCALTMCRSNTRQIPFPMEEIMFAKLLAVLAVVLVAAGAVWAFTPAAATTSLGCACALTGACACPAGGCDCNACATCDCACCAAGCGCCLG